LDTESLISTHPWQLPLWHQTMRAGRAANSWKKREKRTKTKWSFQKQTQNQGRAIPRHIGYWNLEWTTILCLLSLRHQTMKQVVLLFPGTLEKEQKTKQKQVSKSRYKSEVKKFHDTLDTESLISTGLILLLLLLLLLLLRLLLQGLCSSQSRKLNEAKKAAKIYLFNIRFTTSVSTPLLLRKAATSLRCTSASAITPLQFPNPSTCNSIARSRSLSLSRSLSGGKSKIQSPFIRPKIRVSDCIRLSSQLCSNPDPGCLWPSSYRWLSAFLS